MIQTKRWTVTYTKHMKQKRKVYHDGVLEVSSTCKKVMLYDDCKNLIDSRSLKQDEIIECGAALTFGAHLVDIGEPEGDHTRQTSPNVSRRDMKLNGSSGEQGQKYIYCRSLLSQVYASYENKKTTFQSRLPQNYSYVNHNSINDSKKGKLQSRSSHIHSNAIPSRSTVGNEAKRGSSGVLQSHPDAMESTVKEWGAMYTTQKTQKAKRYHDGALRLEVCGSHMSQVILLNEGGEVLSSKYLKSVECIGAGNTFEFPSYLVEIGDPRVSLRDDPKKCHVRQVASFTSSRTCKFTTPKKDHNNNPLPNGDTLEGIPEQSVGRGHSNAQKLPTSMALNQELRDACQIMSVLKKPLPEENLDQRKLPVEYASSCSSTQMVRHSKILNVPGTTYSKRTVMDNHKGESQQPEIRAATQADTSARPCLDSDPTQIVPSTGVTIVIENGYEENPPAHKHSTSSNDLSGTLKLKASSAKSDMDYTGSECVDVKPSTTGPETNTCTLPVRSLENAPNSVFFKQFLQLIVPVEKPFGIYSDGNQHTAGSSSSSLKEYISADGSTGTGGNVVSSISNTKSEISKQLFAENKHTQERENRIPSLDALSPACTTADPRCKELEFQCLSKKCLNVVDMPSFDLGF